MTIREFLRKPFASIRFATPVDLRGKHMIVTGCSVGSLGYETAKTLACWGATVIISTRNNTAAIVHALQQELIENSGSGRIDGHNLDLAQADSVDQFSRWYVEHYGHRLDCLVNNAGIHLDLLSRWKQPKLSSDGEEIQWRTNYLGTVHLTHRLLPILKSTGREFGEARVVNVVSQLHSRGSNALLFDPARPYESWQAYGLSKLGLNHFTTALDRHLGETDKMKSYCVHPGGRSGAYTNVADGGLKEHPVLRFVRKLGAPLEKLFMASAWEGAQTQIYCATDAAAESGHYHLNCQRARASEDSYDSGASERLWRETEQWLGRLSPPAHTD